MGVLQYFSASERDKRDQAKQQKACEEKKRKADDLVRSLLEPTNLQLAEYIGRTKAIEDLCGWPPEREYAEIYLKVLGFRAMAELWLAENVHLLQFYPRGGGVSGSSNVLTWNRAAQAALQAVERGKFALHALGVENAAPISGFFDGLQVRAEKARGLGLQDAIHLPTFARNRVGGSAMLSPEIVGAARKPGTMEVRLDQTSIPRDLRESTAGWLHNRIAISEEGSLDSRSLNFAGVQIIIAEDPSDTWQARIEDMSKAPQQSVETEARCRMIPGIRSLMMSLSQGFMKYLGGVGPFRLHGGLPLADERKLPMKPDTEAVTLWISQGPHAGATSFNVAVLVVDVPGQGHESRRFTLTTSVSERGCLSVSASVGEDSERCRVRRLI